RNAATRPNATGRPRARRHARPHQSAPRNSTIPPSGRTPVTSATAKPRISESGATTQVGSGRRGTDRWYPRGDAPDVALAPRRRRRTAIRPVELEVVERDRVVDRLEVGVDRGGVEGL